MNVSVEKKNFINSVNSLKNKESKNYYEAHIFDVCWPI